MHPLALDAVAGLMIAVNAVSSSSTTELLDPKRLLLLLGLSFFFGLAFEGFHHGLARKPPGGVRSFPMLALLGAGLYVVDRDHGLAFAAGLLVLGIWTYAYYRRVAGTETSEGDQPGTGLMAPVCNLVAYLLGPVSLTAPSWFSVGLTVAAVLLLSARERLHALAYRMPMGEIMTLGKFLVLTGIILPLLPNEPITSWTAITPYEVWLAVVAISSLSYGSYLMQRYLPIGDSVLLAALLGGLYSSTATTVVMARRLHGAAGLLRQQLQAGIVAASAIMYLRVGVIIAVFNLSLARVLAPALGALFLAAILLSVLMQIRRQASTPSEPASNKPPENPLELSAAILFAAAFVLISLASTWVKTAIGQSGLLWLAAIVGVADVDPFILNLAQGGVAGATNQFLAVAVLVAASSNNLLKAGYAVAFSAGGRGLPPAAGLAALSVAGFAIAAWL
jgi:uncharacterized membrane protein (DUF4010 family)